MVYNTNGGMGDEPPVVSRTFLMKIAAIPSFSYLKRIFLFITGFTWCTKVHYNWHNSYLTAKMEVL